jgi:DNA-binding transcriptional ArsR family regulator
MKTVLARESGKGTRRVGNRMRQTERKGSQMNPRVRASLEARVRVLKAMAHPTRLYIVEELAKRERCVHELTDMVGADMSTVSKHLSILKSVGLVRDEKRGAEVHYRLRMPCLTQFFDCIEAVLTSAADDLRCVRSK